MAYTAYSYPNNLSLPYNSNYYNLIIINLCHINKHKTLMCIIQLSKMYFHDVLIV